MTYNVYTLDVWGNPDEGYDVNDRCKAGTVELDEEATRREIVTALIEADFLAGPVTSPARFEVDNDGSIIHVDLAENGRPLLTLEALV